MKLSKTVISICISVMAIAVLDSVYKPVYGIPAFARKYNFSCSTCHDPFPRLKEYGEEFAGNGFALADQEEPPRAFRNTGDDRLTLMRELPLGIRFDAYYSLTPEEEVTNDFKHPWGLKVLSGGNVAKNVGYYFYFYMSEHGEIAGIEDAYVHFNNIGGTELDIMVGQFQISDPLLKRELRLTYEDYEPYKTKVGQSLANLKYDRGIIFTYGTETGTDMALEILNGTGKDESEDGNYDFDSDKSFFFRIVQDMKLFNLGGFTYYGNEKANGRKNEYIFAGPDINISNDHADFNLQYIYRRDNNPTFTAAPGDDIITEGIIGELFVMPKDYLYTVFLYNKIWDNSDLFNTEYETATANLTYLYNTNLKMMAEFTYDIERESTRFILGFVTGF
ncbi:hypothetical protein ACFL6G_07045 [candidate division KSB1 bacterium]